MALATPLDSALDGLCKALEAGVAGLRHGLALALDVALGDMDVGLDQA